MRIKKFSIKNYDMKKYYGFLEKTVLFQGCDDKSIENMLDCLSAEIRTYDKDEVVFHTGDVNVPLGVVLSGKVHIGQSDVFGNYNIMSDAKPGEFFAESFACARNIPMIPEVVADEKSEILFLGIEKVLSTCRGACQFHTKLVSNLVTAIASKNIRLMQKITDTAPKSIRERVLSYLSYQSEINESDEFDIAYNRQQMADYLGVDRSALSAELGRMRDDGIIAFRKNHFRLLTSC